jgi:Tat protein secretion system quality control protein TatD with DNase activity
MVSIMDQAGVSRIVLMALKAPPGEARDRLTLTAHERYPDRVIPFLGLNGVDPISRAVLDYLDRQLSSGKFRGMGEVLVRHYGFSITKGSGTIVEAGDFTIPADSPGVLDLMCLAAKHNVVLTVHMETEAATVSALERALQRNPHTKVIWAHQTHLKTLDGPAAENARKADPEQVASLLDRYPNLYADIAPGHEASHFVGGDRQLPANWKSLYERYSDRFVVGNDQPFLANWQEPDNIRTKARLIRGWLAQLSPTTQRKLASENMERILAARPASIQTCQFQVSAAAPRPTAAPTPTPTPQPTPTPAPAFSAQTVPLIDAHSHLSPDYSPSDMLSRLAKAGVAGVVLFGSFDPLMVAQRQNPGSIFPSVQVGRDRVTGQLLLNEAAVNLLRQQLDTGVVRGIGELSLRHRTFAKSAQGDNYPADGPIPLQIYDLAASYRVPVNVHVEHQFSAELERALEHNRNAIIIWAHIGDGPATLVSDLMRRHPNLYTDISMRNPYVQRGFPIEQQSLTHADGALKEEWRAVFEEFPDRFLFGIDVASGLLLEMVEQVVQYYRSVLAQLTPTTAVKIANGNIKRLLFQTR